VRKATTPPYDLVFSLLGYRPHLTETDIPQQIEWGKTLEPVAHQDYIRAMNEKPLDCCQRNWTDFTG